MVVLVHQGVLHDLLYAPLLGEEAEFLTIGRVGEVFCRYCQEQLLLDALHGDGLDAHHVNAELVLRVGPGDEFRVNGSVDNRLMGENASLQHYSFVITDCHCRVGWILCKSGMW